MPQPKYLWRTSVRGVNTPIYLVAQNVQSCQAQASKHPLVDPADVKSILRLAAWDDQENMSVVIWPEPPPEPEPEPEPGP